MPDATDSWRQHLEEETAAARSSVGPMHAVGLGLTVLLHPDLDRVGEFAPLAHLDRGSELSRRTPEFAHPTRHDFRPLADPRISRTPLRITDSGDDVGIELGHEGQALRVDGVAVEGSCEIERVRLEEGVVLELGRAVVLLLKLDPLLRPATQIPELVGYGPAMAEVQSEVCRVAPSEVPVLVRGETGTGKELVARAIHERSSRRSGPWAAVNLGALPPELASAELFGATAGAYTGAKPREGLFRSCDGGTLFLDEVGEASAEVQVALLRVLQEGTVRPVGADRETPVSVRVVAATDSNLEVDVREGRVRAPLLQRLAGYELRMPPLRARREDIGVLLVHFLAEALGNEAERRKLEERCRVERPWLPARYVARLAGAPFHGNVRELKNVADRLIIRFWQEDQVEPSFGFEGSLTAEPSPDAAPSGGPTAEAHGGRMRDPLDVTEDELVGALRESHWEVAPAARLLGLARSTLYDLIDASPRVRRGKDLSQEELELSLERCDGRVSRMVRELEVSAGAIKARLRQLGIDPRDPRWNR